MNKSEQLIACLEGEIAKRDARIVELESDLAGTQSRVLSLQDQWRKLDAELAALKAQYQRDVYGLNNEGDPIGGDPAGGYANDNARLRKALCRASLLRRVCTMKGIFVSVELLERVLDYDGAVAIRQNARHELRALLSTPSPAGVDGWDVAGDILEKLSAAQLEIDHQAQRIGELEGLLREVRDTYRAAIHWEDLRGTMKRIDAALSAGKEGE